MEITVLEKNKDKTRVSFSWKGAPIKYVNTIRRIMIDEVPTLAVEEIELKKNSSVLYDEMVAHRIGLTVLKTDLKTYNLTRDCNCKGEGCAKCQVKGTLKAKGPSIVYASELKIKDIDVKAIYPETPIAKLLKNQELELEATITLGEGRQHVKWSPGLVYYRYKPVFKKNEITLCPKHSAEFKSEKLNTSKPNAMNAVLCEACVQLSEQSTEVTFDKNELIFFIESWGALSYREIALKSIEVFDAQLEDFAKEIKKK